MAQFGDLRSVAGLALLDKHLLAHSYVGGVKPSQSDVGLATAVDPLLDSGKYPSVRRWLNHINSFSAVKRAGWPGQKDEKKAEVKGEAAKGAPGGAPTPAAADEATDDPFAEPAPKAKSPFDDDEEPTEEEKAKEAMMAAKAKKMLDERAAKGKKVEAGRSTLILDVKPLGSDTDMKQMEDAVRKIAMDGLRWAGSELVPIGYGIKKLRIISVIVDDLVSTDVLREKIEAMEDFVQSTDVFAFNKV